MRSLLRLAFVLPALALSPVLAPADSQYLTMDALPSEEGWQEIADGGGSSTVSNGILTIDSPSDRSWWAPDAWLQSVDSSVGWHVEFRTRLVAAENGGSLGVWIHDLDHLLVFYLEKNQVYIGYPTVELFPMDTTDAHHTYSISGQGNHVDILIDGALVFAYDYGFQGDGTEALIFGDMAGGYWTLSDWDYFYWSTDGLPVPAENTTWGRIKSLYRS